MTLANVTNETTNISSPAQDRALSSIDGYFRARKRPPSLEDVAELCGVSRSSARDVINRLKRRGLVDFIPGEHRSLSVTRAGRRALNAKLTRTN